MSGIINRLPTLLANQIAAGEVVQSPASVIKELMENSVDAGATYVIVSVKEGGKSLIQVIDDGKGMSKDDAFLAFERHATSKIATLDDLFSINTFGFRGEALASIASVAEVELSTRREDDDMGIKIEINGGTLVRSEAISMPSGGSQFVVRNLFYNIPARKKSLKSDLSEVKKVIKEFEKVVLCHPKIAFSLYSDDKLLFMLPATNNIRQRIVALSSKSLGNSLVELYIDTSMVEVKGYIGRPESSRKRPETFLFVNGRYFESPYFFKAVQNGYDKLVVDGNHVPYFLYLQVDTDKVDVNISPTKTTVKFEEEQAIWQIINAAVRESLGKNGIIPMIDFDSDVNSDENSATMSGVGGGSKSLAAYSAKIQSSPDTLYNPFNDNFSFTKAMSGKQDTFHDSYTDFERSKPLQSTTADFVDSFNLESSFGSDSEIEIESSNFTFSADVEYEEVAADEFQQEELFSTDLQINNIFTIFNKYAVVDIDGSLYIFDIKRLVKNANYYRFLNLADGTITDKVVESQKLLFPADISFSVEDKLVVENSHKEINSLGFKFEPIEESSSMLRFTHAPSGIEASDVEWFIEEMLQGFKFSDAHVYQRSVAEQLAISYTRTLSRKPNQYYSNQELSYMIDEIITSKNYIRTIDSKPIMVVLTEQQLAQMLGK